MISELSCHSTFALQKEEDLPPEENLSSKTIDSLSSGPLIAPLAHAIGGDAVIFDSFSSCSESDGAESDEEDVFHLPKGCTEITSMRV